MTEPYSTHYMSHVVDLPPLTAQAAFEALFVDQPHPVVLAAPSRVRLHVTGPAHRPVQVVAAPIVAVPATLRAGSRRLPVDLELRPWSSSRVEVGFFPLGRRPGAPSPRLMQAGHVALGEVGLTLLTWAERTWLLAALGAGQAGRHEVAQAPHGIPVRVGAGATDPLEPRHVPAVRTAVGRALRGRLPGGRARPDLPVLRAP